MPDPEALVSKETNEKIQREAEENKTHPAEIKDDKLYYIKIENERGNVITSNGCTSEDIGKTYQTFCVTADVYTALTGINPTPEENT